MLATILAHRIETFQHDVALSLVVIVCVTALSRKTNSTSVLLQALYSAILALV